MEKSDVTVRCLALANRCRLGMMMAALNGSAANYHYFRGGLEQLEVLLTDELSGFAGRLALRDAESGGYQPPASLQAAWAALPVSLKNMAMAQMQEHLRTHAPDFTS